MKKRGLVIGLLIMLAVITSGFTYAFWAASVAGDDDTALGTINIGKGQQAVTTVNIEDVLEGKKLVPAGFVVDSGTQTASVNLHFSVAWTTLSTALTGSQSVGDLTITPVVKFSLWNGTAFVEVTNVHPLYDQIVDHILVDANVANADEITLGASATTISYAVTLVEPSNVDEYNFFANGKIEITFTFVVDNVVTSNS